MKKSNKIMTIVLSMLLMISGFFAMPFKKASADDPEVYTSFYYFSDNPDCTTYYNGFMGAILDGYNMPTANRHLYNWSNYNFEEEFANWYSFNVNNIQDALIVFEMSKGFAPECITADNTYKFTSLLYDAFTDLNSTCKIMFICSTDETRFDNDGYNAFLGEVDIHINTDMMTIMMGTILNRIGQDGFFNANIILNADALLVIEEYLVPFYRSLYPSSLSATSYAPEDILQIMLYLDNIKVIRPFEGSNTEYSYYTYDEETNDFNLVQKSFVQMLMDGDIDFNELYSIGSLFFASNHTSYCSWINSMMNYSTDEFPIYTYNISGQSVSSQYSYYTQMYETGHGIYHFYNGSNDGLTNPTSWATIFEDFVYGEDLTIHDNYDGLCDVTYKTAIIGPGGWLDFSGFDCWDIYMEEDIWSYYHGI